MSQRALLKAAEADLRAMLSDADGRLAGVQPAPGAPPNNCGQWYYAVHAATVTGDDPVALSHARLYGLQVTITARMAAVPKDRKGDRLTLDNEMMDRAEAVADRLHMSYAVMNDANARIEGFGVTTDGFVEPLKLQTITPPTAAAAEWVGGEADDPDVLVSTVTLAGALRVRPLS